MTKKLPGNLSKNEDTRFSSKPQRDDMNHNILVVYGLQESLKNDLLFTYVGLIKNLEFTNREIGNFFERS